MFLTDQLTLRESAVYCWMACDSKSSARHLQSDIAAVQVALTWYWNKHCCNIMWFHNWQSVVKCLTHWLMHSFTIWQLSGAWNL